MEPKKTFKVFRYQSDVGWNAARRATVCTPDKPDIQVSSPPEFKGEAGYWTPEEMLVASVNACTLMTFLAYAQHKGLELLGYQSEGEGVLESVEGKYRFTEITLHPHIRVKTPEDVERARALLSDAHANCFVANSLALPVKVFPEIRVG